MWVRLNLQYLYKNRKSWRLIHLISLYRTIASLLMTWRLNAFVFSLLFIFYSFPPNLSLLAYCSVFIKYPWLLGIRWITRIEWYDWIYIFYPSWLQSRAQPQSRNMYLESVNNTSGLSFDRGLDIWGMAHNNIWTYFVKIWFWFQWLNPGWN